VVSPPLATVVIQHLHCITQLPLDRWNTLNVSIDVPNRFVVSSVPSDQKASSVYEVASGEVRSDTHKLSVDPPATVFLDIFRFLDKQWPAVDTLDTLKRMPLGTCSVRLLSDFLSA